VLTVFFYAHIILDGKADRCPNQLNCLNQLLENQTLFNFLNDTQLTKHMLTYLT